MSLNRQLEEFSWEQKWRPSELEHVVLPVAMRNEIDYYTKQAQIPHLLLHSPSPGTGKTTTSLAIAASIGCVRPMVINASKDTDVGTIRTKVIQYATGASLINRQRKVVVLDEVERLSSQAQDALKGIMEDVSHVCSFILTTNHVHQITEQLDSRCTRLDFVFTAEDRSRCAALMAQRCCTILDAEKVKYDKRVVAQIIMKCAPDYRRTVKLLQQMTARYGEIGAAALGDLKQHDLSGLIEDIRSKNYGNVLKWVTDNSGNIGGGIYRQMFDTLKPLIEPQSIAELVILLGEEQKDHSRVPDMFVHMTRLMTLIMGTVEFKG